MKPHRMVVAFLLAVLACMASGQSRARSNDAPLPNSSDLMQRALANESRLAAEQERYDCRVTDEEAELDSKGKVKKSDVEIHEQFYVNGVEVQRLLARNGRDLTPGETRKEDERVMKQTLKYSDSSTARKETGRQNKEMQDILTAMMLIDGRREQVDGRSVLFYVVVPNARFHAKNIEQRFAQMMQGTISIDEATGEPIDINIRSTKDLKIAGGVLVSLHKGFWLHMHDHAQPDGVWLTDLVEGSGDARAVLFLHPYFRFEETTGDCRLYTATAKQVGQAKTLKQQ